MVSPVSLVTFLTNISNQVSANPQRRQSCWLVSALRVGSLKTSLRIGILRFILSLRMGNSSLLSRLAVCLRKSILHFNTLVPLSRALLVIWLAFGKPFHYQCS
jgi:hypothetical protein